MKQKEEDEKKKKGMEYLKDTFKKERRFFSEDGKPYSFNDPKYLLLWYSAKLTWKLFQNLNLSLRVDYEYNGDNDESIILTVHVFKHMDTSLINVDIQPNYVRVTLKGKSLQLGLNEEIRPDSSTAKRSQTTGYLVITMPKVKFKVLLIK